MHLFCLATFIKQFYSCFRCIQRANANERNFCANMFSLPATHQTPAAVASSPGMPLQFQLLLIPPSMQHLNNDYYMELRANIVGTDLYSIHYSNWRYVALLVVLWCPALSSSSASVTALR